MGYVFDFQDARVYDAWFSHPLHQVTAGHERALMDSLIRPRKGLRLLDIGCGTGRELEYYLGRGLDVTGLEPSPYMLDLARKRLGHRAGLHRGFGEDLPFDDNSFDVAVLMTTLEFCENPGAVFEEAARVARHKVVLGCLNRFALKGWKRRIRGLARPTVYSRARFFSVWQLKDMVHASLGDVPIHWRTTCFFPESDNSRMVSLERSPWVMRNPFGAFVGLSAFLNPRFRTRPLALMKSEHGRRNLSPETLGALNGLEKGGKREPGPAFRNP